MNECNLSSLCYSLKNGCSKASRAVILVLGLRSKHLCSKSYAELGALQQHLEHSLLHWLPSKCLSLTGLCPLLLHSIVFSSLHKLHILCVEVLDLVSSDCDLFLGEGLLCLDFLVVLWFDKSVVSCVIHCTVEVLLDPLRNRWQAAFISPCENFAFNIKSFPG